MLKIQLNNPTILSRNEEESMNLEDAIEFVFPLETENLILVWNNINIPLTYKYDISLMIYDFMKILQFIEEDENSDLEINWASNTFASIWRFNKIHNYVYIKTEWNNVIGGTVDMLNKQNENTLKTSEFVKEIKKLLQFLKYALEQSGVNLYMIEDFEKLESICR